MENKKTLNQLSEDFLVHLKLPAKKAKSLFVISTIGLVGSGRTVIAKKITEALDGAVLVQANSARYLLQNAGLSWGENVREILKQVGRDLLSKGYGVVFDGNAADEEDRKNITEMVEGTEVKVFYIRILIDPEVAKQREKEKYDNPAWISSFEDFRVNTTEKMLQNIDERAEVHQNLIPENIPNLVEEIDNNGTMEALEQQVQNVIKNIKTYI